MTVAAISSRVQPLTGRSCSVVLLVAVVTTAMRASGGKVPGPAGARRVLKSDQAMLGEAFAPLPDGVAVTVQKGGDILVGGAVVSGGEQDDAAAEGERLGGGTRPSEGFQLAAEFIGQFDGGAERTRHGCSLPSDTGLVGLGDIMAPHFPLG